MQRITTNIATTGKERTVAVCKESLPTSCMVIDKKTLLAEAAASAKRNRHIQCFTFPTHAIDGYIKNICTSKEEIGIQKNDMGGVGAQHVKWDEVFFEKVFAEAWQCISAVTGNQKSLARFRTIAESLTAK